MPQAYFFSYFLEIGFSVTRKTGIVSGRSKGFRQHEVTNILLYLNFIHFYIVFSWRTFFFLSRCLLRGLCTNIKDLVLATFRCRSNSIGVTGRKTQHVYFFEAAALQARLPANWFQRNHTLAPSNWICGFRLLGNKIIQEKLFQASLLRTSRREKRIMSRSL